MIVIVAGSRAIRSAAIVRAAIADSGFEITELVTGREPNGVDRLGEEWAVERGILVTPFPAAWSDLSHPDAVIRTGRNNRKYDAKAGPRRNKLMAEYVAEKATPGEGGAVVVYDGRSAGSSGMAELALRHGLRLFEYIINVETGRLLESRHRVSARAPLGGGHAGEDVLITAPGSAEITPPDAPLFAGLV